MNKKRDLGDRANTMFENAKKNFAVNKAPWTDRTRPAVMSLIGSHLMEVEELTIPPEMVKTLRHALENVQGGGVLAGGRARATTQALAWLNERYDEDGDLKE